MLVFAFLILGLVSRAVEGIGASCSVQSSSRKRCGLELSQNDCESKGCCWDGIVDVVTNKSPICFLPEVVEGYSLTDLVDTDYGLHGKLSLLGKGHESYGADLTTLVFDLFEESSDIVRVKITDAGATRWEVPTNIISVPQTTSKPLVSLYSVEIQHFPFRFQVYRKSDKSLIFDFDPTFMFKDQYIEFTVNHDKDAKTFGLGESARIHQILRVNHTYTLWANDLAALFIDQNLYGSYPYYVQMINGSAHGALLMNSNGMDVVLKDDKITFKIMGGIIDLYVFTGSTPTQVVDQYTQIVGRPAMMPYWSLGFHNCKYGYTSITQVEQVVANYSAAGIPLDTQWMDIDYMQNYRDFTLDSVDFPQSEVSSFVQKLHNNGQHFVPIIDPGIMVYPGYDAYEEGKKLDLFVKDLSGGYYLGQVWPGPTYFPDFFHPATQDYWTEQLKKFHDIAEYDGLWIDMNEVSNFCNHDGKAQVCVNTAPDGCPAPGAKQSDCCLVCSTIDSNNTLDFPPYQLHNFYSKLGTADISAKTMALSASHYGNISYYNAHNLYGLMEQIATNKALKDIRGIRPFVLSRSSFVSTGVHSAKWTGDNAALWIDLKSSIVSIMDFNLFGVPMIGADICGFIYNTTEELCARWIEVGAFYPFSRAHNDLGQAPQELYLWDSVATASRNALGMRYQILPYLYTLFYHAHTSGDMVARALWVNYPADVATLTIDRQFMLGKGILISPVLDKGETSVNAYFPQDLWYSFPDRTLAIDASSGGVWQTLDTPLTSINVHVRGGTILPLQQPAMTTTQGRKTPFTLFIALCPYGKAFGDLFWDDGEQISLDNYIYISFEANTTENGSGLLTSQIIHNSYDDASEYVIGNIVFTGKNMKTLPKLVTLNEKVLPTSQILFDQNKNILQVVDVNIRLNEAIKLNWLIN